jgi:hypothetical protein
MSMYPPVCIFSPPSPHSLPPHTVLLLRTQDTDVLLRAAGGKPPLTMQAFTKLVDKVGAPPAPLAAPSTLPPLGPMPNDVGPVDVPALAELGFTGEPSTIFKVRYNDNTCNTALSALPWHALSTACMCIHRNHPCHSNAPPPSPPSPQTTITPGRRASGFGALGCISCRHQVGP